MKELDLLGKRIKELRKNRRFSQEQLAEKAGISSKYVSRIEMGHHFPSIGILGKLGHILDVELKDFFEFAHLEKSAKQLKTDIRKMLDGADVEKLKLAAKVLKTLLR
ncbi:MAG: helix-turn-helix transcriptional regulator [Nitrospinota bacterium]